jgi:hypothetical protein
LGCWRIWVRRAQHGWRSHLKLQNIATKNDNLFSLRVISESEVYAIGQQVPPTTETAAVFHTTDAGASWTKSFVPSVFSSAVFATSAGNIWTAGYDGVIYHQSGVDSTLQLVSAVSRKTHSEAGTFDIVLPLTGEPGVECRNTGGKHTLVFTFSSELVSGTAAVSAGTGTAATPTLSGATMTVPLCGVTDVQTITVTLKSVTDTSGHELPDTAVSVAMLTGDTTGNKTVERSDVMQTRDQVDEPVTAANFRGDVRVTGTINRTDVRQVRLNLGHSL